MRMNIEQRLTGTIWSFRLGAFASGVPLNVDLDVVLSVLDYTTCAALPRRLLGYAPPPRPARSGAGSCPPADHHHPS
jgi:hypothetical protein